MVDKDKFIEYLMIFGVNHLLLGYVFVNDNYNTDFALRLK